MNTAALIRISLVVATMCQGIALLAQTEHRQRPNILLCISDDQSWLHTVTCLRKHGFGRESVASQPDKGLALPLANWAGKAEGDRCCAVAVVVF